MDALVSIFHLLLIVLGFGFLIFVHELGHFLAAKWAGIRAEAFAVGMGPVALAWRKGIGLRFGSTAKEYEQRVRDHLAAQPQGAPSKLSLEEAYRIGDKLGIGETEYSLRWLPLGGFVKMLGQEDANPNYVSQDPRSYQNCPIGKRMVVVSAGVIMNILLAIVLFVIAFMVGVRFEAPVVGETMDTMPAAQALPENADRLGITTAGLQPGDEVLAIDGQPARTFADIQIASAMSKPGVPVKLAVAREGFDEPLQFSLLPKPDSMTRLLSIGILPGSSSQLSETNLGAVNVAATLEELGLAQAGVKPGMAMVAAEGEHVRTFEQFQRVLKAKDGEPVRTQWQALDENGEPTGPAVEAEIAAKPEFQVLLYPELVEGNVREIELGLIGLAPLVKIEGTLAGSANEGVLKEGDVVLRVGNLVAPLMQQFMRFVRERPGETFDMLVLRDGEQQSVTVRVNKSGQVGVELAYAWDMPNIAAPMTRLGVASTDANGEATGPKYKESPVASLNLMPGDRILEAAGRSVKDWTDIREALRRAVRDYDPEAGAQVELVVQRLFWDSEPEYHLLTLGPDDCAKISSLGWDSTLPRYVFKPLQTTLSAGGNPFTAVAMGVRETHKLVLLVYLTIDRLVRGSVGVEQLRGPVGIVDLGAKIIPQGAMYFLFFLGMISVNLAVINFLPLPIVDGGLFLFLVYEKIKGQPPPLAFQSAATFVGIALIGTLFLVTFYNDVMRLIT